MLRLLPAIACVLCVPFVAAPAGAKPLHATGETPAFLAGDGSRYVGWARSDGTTRIVDSRERTTLEVQTPAGCGAVVAIGGGQLAWNCSSGAGGRAMLLDLRTLAVHEPVGMDEFAESETMGNEYVSAVWTDVGSHWLYGTETIFHSGVFTNTVALDWRTGETRRDEPDGRRVVPDLNRPDLTRRLCDPLRRQKRARRDFDAGDPPFLDFQYARPFGLSQVARMHGSGEPTYSAVLGRCGTKRRVRLGPYSRLRTQVGAGWVTWTSDRYAHAQRLRTGERLRWKLPVKASVVVHTARRLYVLAGNAGATRLYSTALR